MRVVALPVSAAQQVRQALAPWRWVLVPLALVLLSRAAVLAVGYIGRYLVPDSPRLNTMFRSPAYTARPDLGPWYAWDASWYAAIALDGYQTVGPAAASMAFWPMLPLLEGLLSRLLRLVAPHVSPGGAVLWAGLLIVLVAFAIGAALLYRLVLEDHGPDVARRTVAMLAFAPGALYYTAPYPEALLLAGLTGCLWALRCHRWLLAGLSGCFAALAHVPGCLLVVPFAWEYLRRCKGRIDASGLWLLLIPLGPALWLLYLWTLTGDPLAPARVAQTYWPHRWAWPWETLLRGAQIALANPQWEIIELLNVVAVGAALGAALWALRAGHASWGLWSLALLALYLSLPAFRPLDGMLRYTLPVLPLWLLLARVARHPAIEGGVIGALATLLGLMTALYVKGYWIA